MQPKRGREFWRKLVRAYERSGLDQRVFCERHAVTLGTFQHWLYKLRHEAKEAGVSGSALVRVQLPEPVTASALLEANLSRGVVLRFATGTDPRYVAALVAEMEGARC